MAKKQAAGGLISPTNLWGKPLPTTKQSPLKKSSEEVTGKMTDSDDVMDDEEIDVDAELANADVDDEELVEAEAEEDSEVTSELAGDDDEEEEEDADEEPEYEDDDVEDSSPDVVEDDEEEVVTAVADDEDTNGDDNVSDPNDEDVSVMAEKMSLSDHVRAEIARRQKSGESLRGKDILDALSKRKINVSAAQISQLLKKAGLGGKTRGRAPAAPAATSGEKGRAALKAKKRDVETAPPTPATPRQALKARPATGNGFKVPMSQLQAAEAFVEACGGSFKAAGQILTAAEQLSQTFGN